MFYAFYREMEKTPKSTKAIIIAPKNKLRKLHDLSIRLCHFGYRQMKIFFFCCHPLDCLRFYSYPSNFTPQFKSTKKIQEMKIKNLDNYCMLLLKAQSPYVSAVLSTGIKSVACRVSSSRY